MGLLAGFRRRRSLKLDQQGREYLAIGDFARALDIARRLEELCYTGAFEIGALALAGQGELEAAVATLQRGLALAPGPWLNWQLLGNYLSDLERYEEAEAAYARALLYPDVWVDCVRLNQALLASRRGDPEGALQRLDTVHDPELASHVLTARLTALAKLGRYQEVVARAEAALARSEETSGEPWGLITAQKLRAELLLGAAGDDVCRRAIVALERHDGNQALLALISDTSAAEHVN